MLQHFCAACSRPSLSSVHLCICLLGDPSILHLDVTRPASFCPLEISGQVISLHPITTNVRGVCDQIVTHKVLSTTWTDYSHIDVYPLPALTDTTILPSHTLTFSNIEVGSCQIRHIFNTCRLTCLFFQRALRVHLGAPPCASHLPLSASEQHPLAVAVLVRLESRMHSWPLGPCGLHKVSPHTLRSARHFSSRDRWRISVRLDDPYLVMTIKTCRFRSLSLPCHLTRKSRHVLMDVSRCSRTKVRPTSFNPF